MHPLLSVPNTTTYVRNSYIIALSSALNAEPFSACYFGYQKIGFIHISI